MQHDASTRVLTRQSRYWTLNLTFGKTPFQIFFHAHTTEHVNYNYNKARLRERVHAHARFIHIGAYARANMRSLVTHRDTYHARKQASTHRRARDSQVDPRIHAHEMSCGTTFRRRLSHRRRRISHLCCCHGWRGPVLGIQFFWPAGHREHC
jgi:hypothetical protein